MKAADWIDQVKQARGWETDYRAAKELGLSRNTISNYRSGTRTLDDDTALKVARALNIEPEIIVLDQVAERTPVEAVREGVTRVLERIRGKVRAGGGGRVDITSVAAAVAIGAAALAGAPSPSQANTLATAGEIRIVSRRRQRAGGALQQLAGVLLGLSPARHRAFA